MFYVARVLLIICLIVVLFGIVFPIKMSKIQLSILWFTYIISLAVIGYFINPGTSLDLYRMYMEINGFRAGSNTIFKSPMIITNFLYWLVSKTNNNGWLVVIGVLIWGICIQRILAKYLDTHDYETRAVILYFLAANAGCFVIYLLSGIRCSLASAVWVYAYMKWYKEKKWKYYIFAGLTIFIHMLGLVLITFTEIYRVLQKKKNIWTYIAAFTTIALIGLFLNTDLGVRIVSMYNFGYAQFVTEAWNAYLLRGYEFQQQREMMFRIISGILYLLLVVQLHISKNRENEIWGFYILVMFAGFNMSILFERLPYVLGIASLPIINESALSKKGVSKVCFYVVFAIFTILQILWGVYEMSIWFDFKY